MRTPWCKLGGMMGLVAGVWLLAGQGEADQDKEPIWKPVVPEAAYKELLGRAAKTIQNNLDSKKKDHHLTAQVDAVRLAALTLSVQGGDPSHLAAIRNRALGVAQLIHEDKVSKAKVLAADLHGDIRVASVPKKIPDFTKCLELADLMNLYRTKKKGGEGIAPALQSTGPLKKQNGIEEKVRYLAKKVLKPALMEKESDELSLLGYKLAADGALTAVFAPLQKKGPAPWRELSLRMRDAAAQLAQAAAKKDAAAVHKAAMALDAACTQCHSRFRQQ